MTTSTPGAQKNPDLASGYFPLDGGWFDRDYVAALILTHGALGPATMLYLACLACIHGGYEDGLVNSGRNAIALRLKADPVDVEKVIEDARDLGMLDDFDGTPARFTARISGWRADRVRARSLNEREAARERKRLEREKEKAAVTDRDSHAKGAGQTVTVTPCSTSTRTSNKEIDSLRSSISCARELYKTVNEWQQKVLVALVAVAETKRVKGFKPEALLATCDRYGDRDHATEAEAFRFWHLEGTGENAPVKSIGQSWAGWLKRAPSAEKRNAKRGFQGEDRGMPFGLGA